MVIYYLFGEVYGIINYHTLHSSLTILHALISAQNILQIKEDKTDDIIILNGIKS